MKILENLMRDIEDYVMSYYDCVAVPTDDYQKMTIFCQGDPRKIEIKIREGKE